MSAYGGGGGAHSGESNGDFGAGNLSSSSSSSSSLYALCARVPLIKSPAVRVPAPVVLPPGSVHPLPPNLQEYFVYPFSLEHFVLDAAKRRERARRDDMQRRAPGWNEGAAGVLQPTLRSAPAETTSLLESGKPTEQEQQPNEIDEIAQMLDRLGESS